MSKGRQKRKEIHNNVQWPSACPAPPSSLANCVGKDALELPVFRQLQSQVWADRPSLMPSACWVNTLPSELYLQDSLIINLDAFMIPYMGLERLAPLHTVQRLALFSVSPTTYGYAILNLEIRIFVFKNSFSCTNTKSFCILTFENFCF